MTGSYAHGWSMGSENDGFYCSQDMDVSRETRSYYNHLQTVPCVSSRPSLEDDGLFTPAPSYSSSYSQGNYISPTPPAPMVPSYSRQSQYSWEMEDSRYSSSLRHSHSEYAPPPLESRYDSSHLRSNGDPYPTHTNSSIAAIPPSGSSAHYMHRYSSSSSSNYSNSPPEPEYYHPYYAASDLNPVPGHHPHHRHHHQSHIHPAHPRSTHHEYNDYDDQHRHSSSIASYSAFSERPRYSDDVECYDVSSSEGSRASSAGHNGIKRKQLFYEEREPFTRYK